MNRKRVSRSSDDNTSLDDDAQTAENRFKSEVPSVHNIPSSIPNYHHQLTHTSSNLPPDGVEEKAMLQLPTQSQRHKTLFGNTLVPSIENVRSPSTAPRRYRGDSHAPELGNMLETFKEPERPPFFKEEPLDEEVMKRPLRRLSEIRERERRRRMAQQLREAKKKAGKIEGGKSSVGVTGAGRKIAEGSLLKSLSTKKQALGGSGVAERRSMKTTAGKSGVTKGEIGKITTGEYEKSKKDSSRIRQQEVVDLTGDKDEFAQLQHWETMYPNAVQSPSVDMQQGLLAAPSLSRRHAQIPETALQQIRDQYQSEYIVLPASIREWSQLEDFARTNPNLSYVTPGFISRIRARHSSPVIPTEPPPQSWSHPLFSQHWDNQMTGENYADPTQSWPQFTFSPCEANQEETHTSVARMDSEETQALQRNLQYPQGASSDVQNYNHTTLSTPVQRSNQNFRTLTSQANGHHHLRRPSVHHILHEAVPLELNSETMNCLLRPSNAIPDLLPASAPTDHPHLVVLWNDNLLQKVPRTQHRHLSLTNTVVSIVAKYDWEEQSAIRAFFATKEVAHFFFLFKSRTNSWHSWSIERELDIVTIGLERGRRAPNTSESERPSSGQFDVTIQYKMNPPKSVVNPEAPVTGANVNGSKSRGLRKNRATSNSDIPQDTPTPTQTAAHGPEENIPSPTDPTTNPPPTSNNPIAPIIPGRWTLHSKTFLPTSPDLQTFLWSTPPNRGADQIATYNHPDQTPFLPVDHLSMLARYLQHTAFTCTAIEAEFQVVWGRRVKYDAQLGRVRATYDHALKGAKTQAERRRRGEYNRVPVLEGGGGGGGGEEGRTGTNVGVDVEMAGGSSGTLSRKGGREDRPGAGESLGYLAGRDGPRDMNTIREEREREREKGDLQVEARTGAGAHAGAGEERDTGNSTTMTTETEKHNAMPQNTTDTNTNIGTDIDSGARGEHVTSKRVKKTTKMQKKRKVEQNDSNSDTGSDYKVSSSTDEDA